MEAGFHKLKYIGIFGPTILALAGILSYLLEWPLLGRVHPSYIPMAPSTAVAFLTFSFALFYINRDRGLLKKVALALACLAILFSLLEVIGSLVEIDLNLEDSIVPRFGTLHNIPIARMSPSTAIAFLLAGVGILAALLKPRRSQRPKETQESLPGVAGTVLLLGSIVFLLGYLYGTPLLYGQEIIPMALTTAAGFFFLSIGMIGTSARGRFPLSMLYGSSTHTRLMRIFFPLSVGAVLLSNLASHFLPLWIEFNSALTVAAFVILISIITTILVNRVSRSIGARLDRSRNEIYLSHEKYRSLFDSIQDAIVVADESRRVVSCNPAFTRMFGYSLDEISSQSTDLLYEDKGEFSKLGKRLSGLKGSFATTINYRKENGDVFPGETGVSKLLDQEGKVIGFIGLIRDVSEKIRMEKQLQRSQKLEAIGTLAGGIAHDFNNILSSILGFTELALEEVQEHTILSDNLHEVYSAGRRAKALVHQILTISSHRQERIEPIDIALPVKEALNMLRATIPSSIEFREKLCSEPLVVEADETKIHQIVVNLVTNAKQAMEGRPGEIKILLDSVLSEPELVPGFPAEKLQKYACLTVQDSGVGIPEKHLEKIFEPYFTTKEQATGAGLGLSVVHGIVKSHGGQITVDTRQNEGTTFRVYLPLAEKEVSKQSPSNSQELLTGKENILVVDDESAVLKVFRRSLERFGYRVSAMTNSESALEVILADPDQFDLIITDMTMPRLTGDMLAREIKAIRPDLPIILCSGFSEKLNNSDQPLEVDHFLMKPVTRNDLARAVRQVLDESE